MKRGDWLRVWCGFRRLISCIPENPCGGPPPWRAAIGRRDRASNSSRGVGCGSVVRGGPPDPGEAQQSSATQHPGSPPAEGPGGAGALRTSSSFRVSCGKGPNDRRTLQSQNNGTQFRQSGTFIEILARGPAKMG